MRGPNDITIHRTSICVAGTAAGPLDCGAVEDCASGYACLEQREPVPPPRPLQSSNNDFFDSIFGGGGNDNDAGGTGDIFDAFNNLFTDDLLPLQCVKTCKSDLECSRGTCEEEGGGDALDSFFADLFGNELISLCIPTCTKTSECTTKI